MVTPDTRAEFERAIYLLVEQLRQGRLMLPPSMRLRSSLEALRYLPNGRLDFLSVDELARLQANTAAQFADGFFRELKGTSNEDDAPGGKRSA